MPIFSLFIINRFGSLIYEQDLGERKNPPLTSNDHILLGSTFHGLHTISKELTPLAGRSALSSGINLLVADTFRLECYETPTGLKFFLIADRNNDSLSSTIHSVHELYSDYVLKNPFYELDQPIRCEQFDQNIQAVLAPKPERR